MVVSNTRRRVRESIVTTRPSICESLEHRRLFAMAKATGGSGYSGTLSTNAVVRQQQLICDPVEPVAGSTRQGRFPEKSTKSFSPARCTCRIDGLSTRRPWRYRSQNWL